MTTSEVDVLDGVPTPIVLSNGLSVNVNRLKTRETLKLLKILTKGAGYALSAITSGDGEEFAETLLLSMILAIPEAEDETLDFIRAMVVPAEITAGAKAKSKNAELFNLLADALDNPELDDLIDICAAIIKVEAPHLEELGKKIALLLQTVRPSAS